MASVANLVWETSTSTGTGNLTVAAFGQRFSNAFGTGVTTDVFPYFIVNRDVAGEWEYGTGHMSDANTLVRDTVIESSNSDAAVNFSAGVKDVTNDLPADKQRATTFQVFTSSGTYTPPDGVTRIRVTALGGGGAGGGTPATSAGNSSGAGGGASGALGIKVIEAVDLGATETVTIGAGGTGVSADVGGSGGTTSFGAHLSAPGGGGGAPGNDGSNFTARAGGDPTAATGGDINGAGSAGGTGSREATVGISGSGGSSPYGGGGAGGPAVGTVRVANGVGYGAGGSGVAAGASQAAQVGGSGTNGLVIVEEFY